MTAAKASMIQSSSVGLKSVGECLGWVCGGARDGVSAPAPERARPNKPGYGVAKCHLFLARDQLGFSEPWEVSSASGARMNKIHVNLLAGCNTFSFCISHGNLM